MLSRPVLFPLNNLELGIVPFCIILCMYTNQPLPPPYPFPWVEVSITTRAPTSYIFSRGHYRPPLLFNVFTQTCGWMNRERRGPGIYERKAPSDLLLPSEVPSCCCCRRPIKSLESSRHVCDPDCRLCDICVT